VSRGVANRTTAAPRRRPPAGAGHRRAGGGWRAASRWAALRALVVGLAVGLAALAPGAVAGSGQAPDPALREALREAVRSTDSFRNRFDAQVWLLDMSARLASRVPDPERRLRLLRMVHYEARRAGLEPEWVLAVIEVESAFNRFALSSAGARGLMQVMPFWLEEIGRPEDNLFDVATNLRMGCTILAHYLERENGDLTRALARYNGSVGESWYPARVYRALAQRWYAQ